MIHDQSGAGRSLLLYDLLMVAVVALAPSVAPLPARAAASPVHAAAAGTGGGTRTTDHPHNAHTGDDPPAPPAGARGPPPPPRREPAPLGRGTLTPPPLL